MKCGLCGSGNIEKNLQNMKSVCTDCGAFQYQFNNEWSPQKAFGIDIQPDPRDSIVIPMTKKEQKVHAEVMAELQEEWEDNVSIHKERRLVSRGIRSSSISALVSLLIKKGVLA